MKKLLWPLFIIEESNVFFKILPESTVSDHKNLKPSNQIVQIPILLCAITEVTGKWVHQKGKEIW